jgi:O-antigen/teichoic acid export membrane protein
VSAGEEPAGRPRRGAGAAFRRLGGDPGSLRARAIGAGMWSVGGMGLGQALRLAGNLVMTRILAPEAFGLMAMVLTVHMALTMLTDIGINRSVIRSPRGEEPHYLRVAWTVQILRSCLIALMVALAAAALALTAPYWAPPDTVYSDPRLPGLIAVSSLAMVLKGFEPTAVYLGQRSMKLARLTAMGIGSQVVGLAAMVGFAMIEPSVWALLAGMLFGNAAYLIASHILFATPRMKLAWDREIADELWIFGRWLIGSSLAGYVANHADKLILAGFLDKESFGFYVIATLWVQVGVSVIQTLSRQVFFPTISEVLRKRPAQVEGVFRRGQLGLDAICLAGFAFYFLAGAALIGLLYTPQYQAAAVYLALLAFRLPAMRYLSYRSYVIGRGDSLTVMLAMSLRAAVLCAALPLAFHAAGVNGVLLVAALNPLAEAPVLLRRVARLHGGALPVRPMDWAPLALVPAAAAAVLAFG